MQSRASAPTTLEKVLNVIDEFLERDPYGEQLWDILTALRGPDADNPDSEPSEKASTTAPIRARAFPKAAAGTLARGGWAVAPPFAFKVPTAGLYGHFVGHVIRAHEALESINR